MIAGDFMQVFQTPAKAFGAGLVLEIDTVQRQTHHNS
jgi:hypothetical protein